MSKDRKRHGWKFWTAIAVAVPVLYALSIGPAAWLDWAIWDVRPPIWYVNAYELIYRPIIYFDSHEPRWLGNIFAGYVHWCMGDNPNHWWSRLIVGTVVGAGMIAIVVRTFNKRAARQPSRPDFRHHV